MTSSFWPADLPAMSYDEYWFLYALAPPDPVIHISGMLLREWHSRTPDFITLECAPDCIGLDYGSQPEPVIVTAHLYRGDIIRITGHDRKLVYVVQRRVTAGREIWEASWPD